MKMENERDEYVEYEEINLIQYVNVLLKRRWLIVLGVLFCVIFVGIYSFKLPPVFTASAKFLPSKNPEMTSRMGTLLGGGTIESFTEDVTSEYYTELLQSTPFLERILERKFESQEFGGEVDLLAYYEIETDSDLARKLEGVEAIRDNLELSTDRTTKVVSIKYTTREAGLSSEIVNAILDELIRYNQEIRNFKAKQNREFVEKQVGDSQRLLKDAEDSLSEFTLRNKKVGPDLQPDLDRLKRAVRVQEEVYITLTKQLELVKIEEQERTPFIEIIESATPPLRRSGPKRKRNVILAGFVSLIMFMGLAFVLEYFSKLNRNDEKYTEFYQNLDDIKKDFRRITHPFRK
jgi:uncharacterized protein involved in exopolysaccharide biosynthesis